MQVRPEPRRILVGQKDVDRGRSQEAASRCAQATPGWHRARAKDLRRNGFTKMAEEHEQIARTIERQGREQQETK
jgi:hypothetical protein